MDSQAKNILNWLREMGQFNRVLYRTDNLPNLHLVDPDDQVIVYADASEYGVGAYICQIVNDEEQAIAFVSKA